MEKPFFGPDAWMPLVKALEAFVQGDHAATLTVHADEGEPDPMPVSIFFRGPGELREVDRQALRLARGRTLDVGAGVGSITLALQEMGMDVTAVEVIPEAVAIMEKRGVKDPRHGRVQDLPAEPGFDTILLLMNGPALAGTLQGLLGFLEFLSRLLTPGGQILLDSTDLFRGEGDRGWSGGPRALGEGGREPEEGPRPVLEGTRQVEEYLGEVQYQLEFRGERGAPFPQLFVDPTTLAGVGWASGLDTRVVWDGDSGEYLAVLTSADEHAGTT